MTELDVLRSEVTGCTRCDLYRHATTAVWGEGTPQARVVVVGEQPGDQEDRQGRPFVGPAGQLLDRAFAASGLDRGSLYVTNAVKHFKWTPRGKRRLHQSPNQAEVLACRPWLEGELTAVKPELVVALGATAGKAILGSTYRVTTQRGLLLDATVGAWSGQVLGTIHPSAILRVQDPADRDAEFGALVADLTTAVIALSA